MRLSAALVVLATVIVAQPSAAQTVQAVDAVNVVDANGKKVGRMVNVVPVEVVLEIVQNSILGNNFVNLQVDKSGFQSQGSLSFESADCSGTPYVGQLPSAGVLLLDDSLYTVAPPGHTLYFGDANTGPRYIVVRSCFGCGGLSPSCTTFGDTSPVQVQPAVAVNLDTLFTPPFHLEAVSSAAPASCCGDCNSDGTVTVNEIITSVGYALTSCPK